MSDLLKLPVPLIGSAGVFELKTPFSTLPNERCRCDSVRLISDYIANNEDPWTDVYQPMGLTESEYQTAASINLQIVTLITEKGLRIQVPANYIDKYPIQDGVPYRGIAIHVALPPMPVQMDLGFLEAAIRDVVKTQAGVDSLTRLIQTTTTTMVPPDLHETAESTRKLVIGSNVTPYAQISRLQNDLLDAQGKIEQLEAFILSKYSP